MEIISTIKEMQKISSDCKLKRKTIALVPTMGYLHDGHLSLIRKADEIADVVITTLFVNPTQFAPTEDFNSYPRDFERDFRLCKENGSDYLFMPDVGEMYPVGFNTSIVIKGVTEKFEGVTRPTHFQGVATVVAKLFNITRPDFAIFGQKDYQQTLLIKRLDLDLDFGIDIVINPTIRESNGLAMSSRNSYLTPEFRDKASIIHKAIVEAKRIIDGGERDRKIINNVLNKVLSTVSEIKIDYSAAALASSLEEPDTFNSNEEIVILIAVYLGKTRLIDNAIITIP